MFFFYPPMQHWGGACEFTFSHGKWKEWGSEGPSGTQFCLKLVLKARAGTPFSQRGFSVKNMECYGNHPSRHQSCSAAVSSPIRRTLVTPFLPADNYYGWQKGLVSSTTTTSLRRRVLSRVQWDQCIFWERRLPQFKSVGRCVL